MTKRFNYVDNAKGLLIFLVVLGHFLFPFRNHGLIKIISDIIYVFHMPAFIFIAGFFSKKVTDRSLSQAKILFAYIIFNFLMMIYTVSLLDFRSTVLIPYYTYWFLLAIWVWRILTPLISKLPESLLLAFVVSIVVGFFTEIGNQLALSRIIGFFPYFLAGYLLHDLKVDFKAIDSKRHLFHYVAGSIIFLAALFLGVVLSVESDFSSRDLLFMPYSSPGRIRERILLIISCISIVMPLAVIIPSRVLPMLTKWGRNSLSIYVLHRYLPLLFMSYYPYSQQGSSVLLGSIAGTFVSLFVFGSDKLASLIDKFLKVISVAFLQYDQREHRSYRLAFYLFLVVNLAFIGHHQGFLTLIDADETGLRPPIHKVLSTEQIKQIDGAVTIAFAGDFILMRDQILEGFCEKTEKYNFDPVFKYAKPYIEMADYAIGVLEGPLAGKERGFSTSNYGDGIPLYFNFPDEFGSSIQRAGFDLVTMANNHLLDMEVSGAKRTMDVLEDIGLDYVGAYRDAAEKEQIKLVEISGLKVAVLAYTFRSNYYTDEYFFDVNPSITSLLVAPESPLFNRAVNKVKRDFERAQKLNPDLIVVLPHMGSQFIHHTDNYQDTWNDIFIAQGADIVFGSHSHAVQPIEFRNRVKNGKIQSAVIVNCPGNFINSFVAYNGDATAIAKVYIDPKSKKIICAGVVPMWTYAPFQGMHKALPIYEIMFNPELNSAMSRRDMARARTVHTIITQVMLGVQLSLDQLQKVYYLFPDGYYRKPVKQLDLTEELKQSIVYQKLFNSSKVVFVGDSITAGSRNGGFGWYEPIATSLKKTEIIKEGWDSGTTATLLENSLQIASHKADVYVIAIGTNDVRYRNPEICAMTPIEYIQRLDALVNIILSKNSKADFIFVSPWPSLPNDPYRVDDIDCQEYAQALAKYCGSRGFIFSNPTLCITQMLQSRPLDYYLIDHIHPDSREGLLLYSRKFIKAAN